MFNQKVYCHNCSHVRSSSDCFGGVYVRCKKAPIISSKNTPIQIITRSAELKKMNENNDCQFYQKRKWWQLLWANVYG